MWLHSTGIGYSNRDTVPMNPVHSGWNNIPTFFSPWYHDILWPAGLVGMKLPSHTQSRSGWFQTSIFSQDNMTPKCMFSGIVIGLILVGFNLPHQSCHILQHCLSIYIYTSSNSVPSSHIITSQHRIGLVSGGVLQPKLPTSALEETQEGARSECSAGSYH